MTDAVTNDQVDNQPADQTPSLTLQDLVLVAQIIQLTSQRGAIRPDEMTTVGGLYNKLVAFLQSAGAIAPADGTQTEEN